MICRVKTNEQMAAEAREARDWPGHWQSNALLHRFRQHIPTLCEPSWQKAFSALGPDKVLDALEDFLLDQNAIASMLYYGEDIRYLLKSLLPKSLPTKQSKAYLAALFSRVPPFEFIQAARDWAHILSQMERQNADDATPMWEVPIDGQVERFGAKIHFCRSPFEIYRALRHSGIDPRTEDRPIIIQSFSEACLWYQRQIVKVSIKGLEDSILILELVPDTQGYRFIRFKTWSMENNFKIMETHFTPSPQWALEHKRVSYRLLHHLNQPKKQSDRARLFGLCESRKRTEGVSALTYLSPMIATLPETIRSMLDGIPGPEEFYERLKTRCPLTKDEIEQMQLALPVRVVDRYRSVCFQECGD